jgi:hypothetical protein
MKNMADILISSLSLLFVVTEAFSQAIQDGDNVFKPPYFNQASAGLDQHAGRGLWVTDNPDLDKDGRPEILVTEYFGGGRIFVFEIVGDDSMQFVWSSKVLQPDVVGENSTPRTVTVGDFDNDGKQEIIFLIGFTPQNSTRGIYIYEYTGRNNDYGSEPIKSSNSRI